MRPLAVAALLALALPLGAADKDEDKAKEAAVAFAKAVKTKDIDAVMKTVGVPFAGSADGKHKVMEKADELKAFLKEQLDKLKDPDRVPTEAGETFDLPTLRKKAEGKDDLLKMVERVLGENGYGVSLGKDGPTKAVVLVRIKDGKAVVVGLPR